MTHILTPENKFIKFLHENFSNLNDNHKENIKELYQTLKLWTDLQAKKNILEEIKNLFIEKPYMVSIAFSGSWEYNTDSSGYYYDVRTEPVLQPGNYGDYETEKILIQHSIIVGPIWDYLTDLGESERQSVVESLKTVTPTNIDSLLCEIVYEEELELSQKIDSYEKDILSQTLPPLEDITTTNKKFKV